MSGPLRLNLVGEGALSDQAAFRQQLFYVRTNLGFNLYLARLSAIKLEGRKKVDVFNGFDVPSRKQAESGFGEGLDPHHAGEYRSAVNLMVMKEGLSVRVQ